MMKRLLLILMTMAGVMTAQADDYPYLTFETSDGTVQSVSTTSLKLEISGDKLLVNDGAQSFTLTDLKKMYFSTNDATGIDGNVNTNTQRSTLNAQLWFTIDGRLLSGKPTKKGIYINNGRKVIIK
jgi:hypothetical protein